MLFQLLALEVPDLVMMSIKIACNIYNTEDEMLAVIVCGVQFDKVINRSRLVRKVAVTERCCCSLSTSVNRILKVSILFSGFFVEYCFF